MRAGSAFTIFFFAALARAALAGAALAGVAHAGAVLREGAAGGEELGASGGGSGEELGASGGGSGDRYRVGGARGAGIAALVTASASPSPVHAPSRDNLVGVAAVGLGVLKKAPTTKNSNWGPVSLMQKRTIKLEVRCGWARLRA